MKNSKLVWVDVLRTIVAITLSLLIIFVIIMFVSEDPFNAIKSFMIGPLTSVRRMGNVVELMIPLMFTGLATVVLFRTGLFNLSAEGGFFIGSVVAAICALTLNLPPILNLIISLIMGALAGGITTLIPGFLKVKCNANEIVTSLMLNYVCLNVGLFIIHTYFVDPSINTKYTYKFDPGMLLPRMVSRTNIHVGLIIVTVCIIVIHFLMEKTPFGFKATLVGTNSVMANYSGIKSAAVIMGTQMIGGALAGLGGGVELFGMYHRFQYLDLTDYGWDGILVAIVARHKPKLIPVGALFLAYLRIGADIMSRESDVPFELVKIIQAVVILLISSQAILEKYRKKVLIKETRALEEKEA